jgi:tripartite-type tricarboxylate transporter receptor subunit TctC
MEEVLVRKHSKLDSYLVAVFSVGVIGTASAQAQSYPTRPITFVYPYAVGSGSDTVWRIINEEASKSLGQPVVQENRPGAGGRLGFDVFRRATADGYTIGMANNVMTVTHPLADPKLFVEPEKDYTPITQGVESPLILVSRAALPYRDLKGLIAYAKANPGKLNAGSPGVGTGGHLGVAMLNSMAGIDITHVPFKGTALSMTAMLAGDVDIAITDSTALPHVKAGKFVAIGSGSPRPWTLMPDLVALDRTLPGYKVLSWNGVAGPAGLPRDVLERLNRTYREALNATVVRARLYPLGWATLPSTPQELTAQIRSEMKMLQPIIKAANIKLE